jgi:hypothetical protein
MTRENSMTCDCCGGKCVYPYARIRNKQYCSHNCYNKSFLKEENEYVMRKIRRDNENPPR